MCHSTTRPQQVQCGTSIGFGLHMLTNLDKHRCGLKSKRPCVAQHRPPCSSLRGNPFPMTIVNELRRQRFMSFESVPKVGVCLHLFHEFLERTNVRTEHSLSDIPSFEHERSHRSRNPIPDHQGNPRGWPSHQGIALLVWHGLRTRCGLQG